MTTGIRAALERFSTVRHNQPVEIDGINADVAATFTLTGGLGYVPISFHGLARYDGWQLQVVGGPIWLSVDQSVHGNDDW